LIINKLGIIGLGSIGKKHLRLLKEIRPDIEIIVMRSGHGGACKEEKIATKIVYSIDKIIDEGVQAAIISSPATFHLEQSLKLAKAGVHLLIEKPVSHSSDGINELLKILEDNKLKAMVGYVLRYDPGAIKFKKLMESNLIGNILHARIECGSYLPEWRPGRDYKKTVSALSELGGGVLLELSHELDYLHWFFGKPKDVQAKLRNSGLLDIDVEDQVDLLLTSSQGYCISVQIDFNRRHVERKCKVLTTEGEVTWDAVNKNVTCNLASKGDTSFNYDNERDYIYCQQLKAFIDCVENNNNPPVNIKNGIDVNKLIDSIRDASINESKVYL
jgi:predicted dehydrogenase